MLPPKFVTVSCQGQTISSFTGYELAFGTTITNPITEELEDIQNTDLAITLGLTFIAVSIL